MADQRPIFEKPVAELACQIVYEYEGWGSEHVSDMLDTYDASGEEAPCDFDTLAEACGEAQLFKNSGLDIDETIYRLSNIDDL